MARVSRGAGSKGRRPPRPSANELLKGMAVGLFGNDWESVPVSASKAEFNKLTDIMYDNDVMEQYSPTRYQNLAGLPAEEYDQYYDRQAREGKGAFSRQFYEVIPFDTGEIDYIPGFQGPQLEEDESPADLTLVPTSTTNPERPRTVAAGYDEDEEKLTVMFRDGTLYNYYEVTANEWAAFKANRSKGAVIYRMLDFKPRGYADASSMKKSTREAFYRFARGFQSYKGGKVASQNKAVYKTKAQTKRGRKK